MKGAKQSSAPAIQSDERNTVGSPLHDLAELTAPTIGFAPATPQLDTPFTPKVTEEEEDTREIKDDNSGGSSSEASIIQEKENSEDEDPHHYNHGKTNTLNW